MVENVATLTLAVALTLALGSAGAAQASDLQKVKAAAARPTVSPEDIDLWGFSTVNGLAPGRSVADFRAMPNLAKETKDDLRGVQGEPDKPSFGPVGYRFSFSDGLDLRVMDYGDSAFVTRLRINGADRVIKGELKIGGSRAQIEEELGRPARGGGTYSVYEGKTDVVRVFYTKAGAISSVEIDRGG